MFSVKIWCNNLNPMWTLKSQRESFLSGSNEIVREVVDTNFGLVGYTKEIRHNGIVYEWSRRV